MESSRNVPAVLAQCLRAATSQLRAIERRIDAGAVADRRTALESIDAVAAELDHAQLLFVQTAPDPAGARFNTGCGDVGDDAREAS